MNVFEICYGRKKRIVGTKNAGCHLPMEKSEIPIIKHALFISLIQNIPYSNRRLTTMGGLYTVLSPLHLENLPVGRFWPLPENKNKNNELFIGICH